MKILHLLPYEKKFVPVAAEIFDACNEIENSYRIMTAKVTEARKFFADKGNFRVVNRLFYPYSNDLKKDLEWCDCVVVHFMDGMKARAIMRAPDHLPIVWSGWGGDFYNLLPQGEGDLLGEETKRLVKILNQKKGGAAKQLAQEFKKTLLSIMNYTYGYWIKRAVMRVDYCSTPFPEEFRLLQLHLGKNFHPTNKWVLFGHHFAAIAGAGPLIGPVLAAQFGYLPGFLWILIGAVLAGGVHDFIILTASIRREGHSLARIAKDEIGYLSGILASIAIIFIIIVALAGLGLAVVNSLYHNPWGTFTIAMTIPIAILMGFYLQKFLLNPRQLYKSHYQLSSLHILNLDSPLLLNYRGLSKEW